MRHNGHIRERSEGTFEIRYSIGNDPVTGKWVVKTTTFKGTKKEAQRELNRILESIEDNKYVEPTKLTTGEYLKQWIETMRSRVSPKTHERYSEIVNNFLAPSFGAVVLRKLTPIQIQEKYNSWETSGRRDKKSGGLAPRTRVHIHRIFRAALKNAVKIRLIGSNPVDDVLPPIAKKAIASTLTIEQSTVLLSFLQEKHPQLYWPVLLAITTGMRRGEIVALRWKNVDFEHSTIRVLESVEQVKSNIRFKAPKTDKTRAVMLPDYAVEELKGWKENQFKELARLGVTATEDTFVFGRSWDGGVVKPDSLTAEFRVAIREIPNFPIVRFHDLRHSHATQLLKQGIHPKIAQERLGHSTITTTLDLYSHVVETMQNDAVAKLDTAYRSMSKQKRESGPKLG
jgi:integrase